MAMTREEMQRLASYGRDGDTMLAHINPQEAALLKKSGGSGTINPNTGLPEYRFGGFLTGGVKSIAAPIVNPVQTAASQVSQNLSNLPGSVANTVQQVVAPLKSIASPITSADVKSVLSPVSSILNPLKKVASQVSSNLSNLPGSVENTVKQVAANPVAQIALAVYMPGLIAEFAPSLTALGITGPAQTAVANAIASTAVQVAQGVPLDKALQTAVTNAAVSSGSAEITKQINTVISNPDVTKAIVSAGSSAAKTALNGGSQSDIEKNLVAGLVGSGTASATGSNIAGSAAAGGVTGGVTGALMGAASAYGEQKAAEEKAAKDKAAAADLTNKVSTLIGDELKKVGIAGALPAGDTGAYARALENSNQALIRLVKEAANDPAFLQKLPVLEDALTKAGTSISKVLGTGLSLGTYSTELNSNEQAELQKRLKDAKIEITLSPLPLTDVKSFPPVAFVDVNKPEPTPAPTPTPEPAYDPSIVSPITPITPVSPKPSPTPAPITQPVTTPQPSPRDKAIIDIINPPATSPAPSPSPTPEPIARPALDAVPKPVPPSPSPVVSPVVLPPSTTPPSDTTKEVTTPTTTPSKTPISDLPPSDTKPTTPPSSELPPDKKPEKELPPVEDRTPTPVGYDPRLFTSSVLSRTLKTQAPFYPLAGTTGGLTSTRGAGELESKETGKARRNVWNEESLRLKDALGI